MRIVLPYSLQYIQYIFTSFKYDTEAHSIIFKGMACHARYTDTYSEGIVTDMIGSEICKHT